MIGIVSNCETMTIRAEPSIIGDVIGTLPSGSEVMIEDEKPLSGFYKICTASGIEGYCMKHFVKMREDEESE